jgi:hypothetical protein
MFNSPFYRAGNDLISTDGIVIQGSIGADDESNLNYFSINIPGCPVIKVRKREHPEEYERYLALYQSASLLISTLSTQAPKQ